MIVRAIPICVGALIAFILVALPGVEAGYPVGSQTVEMAENGTMTVVLDGVYNNRDSAYLRSRIDDAGDRNGWASQAEVISRETHESGSLAGVRFGLPTGQLFVDGNGPESARVLSVTFHNATGSTEEYRPVHQTMVLELVFPATPDASRHAVVFRSGTYDPAGRIMMTVTSWSFQAPAGWTINRTDSPEEAFSVDSEHVFSDSPMPSGATIAIEVVRRENAGLDGEAWSAPGPVAPLLGAALVLGATLRRALPHVPRGVSS